MAASTVQFEVLQKAVAITGSVEHLARILSVTVADLGSWIEGDELAPTSVFNAAVDLINAASASDKTAKRWGI
jgi:hypothetical protein